MHRLIIYDWKELEFMEWGLFIELQFIELAAKKTMPLNKSNQYGTTMAGPYSDM